MKSFLEMGLFARCLYLLVLFLVTTLAVMVWILLLYTGRNLKKQRVHLATLFVLLVIDIVALFSFFLTHESLTGEMSVSYRGFFASEIPFFVDVIFVVVTLGFLIWLFYKESVYRRNRITKSSIKESLDNLGDGLCFASGEGRIFLANATMQRLCEEITGRMLLNAEKFWMDLQKQADYAESSFANIALADGSMWHFRREAYASREEHVVKLTALDTTDLHRLSNSIQKKNQELEAMNDRLSLYSKNVEQLTKEKEHLELKTKIHGQMGHLLMATRHVLESGQSDLPETLYRDWRVMTTALGEDTFGTKQSDAVRQLVSAAEAASVRLVLDGEIPRIEPVHGLVVATIAEIVTNAARHGAATEVQAILRTERDRTTAIFTNNGKNPIAPITPGGGLGGIELQLKRVGGTMTFGYEPVFSIEIAIPLLREV